MDTSPNKECREKGELIGLVKGRIEKAARSAARLWVAMRYLGPTRDPAASSASSRDRISSRAVAAT